MPRHHNDSQTISMHRTSGRGRTARTPRLAPACAVATLLAGGSNALAGVEVSEKTVASGLETDHVAVDVVRVVDGLVHPWGVDWLPDGRMLVTERPGRMLLIDGEEVTELGNLPRIAADTEGGSQGGLLDVAVHPDYADNGWIYFTYSSPGDTDTVYTDDRYGTGTTLARARLSDDSTKLVDREALYAQTPRYEPGRHYGSRIVFDSDGTVLFSIGDRGLRHPSQDVRDPGGSMIRLTDEGRVPEDNPFYDAGPAGPLPEIFSYGHRNNQGMARHPETGEVWTTEHGPSGGDLLHRLEAGANYGWPRVSFGDEYSTGEPIGIGREAPDVNAPIYFWEDSFAPSGLAIPHEGSIDAWEGDLLAGSLVRAQLWRLRVEEDEVIEAEVILDGTVGRVRDVVQGPDGHLYIATDHADSGLYRIEPAE
ncbi:MAG: PQQ-dependent sugar dehydrogenase [Halorhodospira sp.]